LNELTNLFDEVGGLAQLEDDVKWFYCGIGKDFKNEIVSQAIGYTFTEDEVCLCISSNRSSLVLKSIVVNEIADVIRSHFGNLEMELNNDYGGNMEHLWIDLELIEKDKSCPFRFQKGVGIPTSYTNFYSYIVGHYSVKPDFEKLRELLSEESICTYVFGLLYESTQIIVANRKKPDGFNAAAFRLDFLAVCEKLNIICVKVFKNMNLKRNYGKRKII